MCASRFSHFGKALSLSELPISRFFPKRAALLHSQKAAFSSRVPCATRSFTQFPQSFPQPAPQPMGKFCPFPFLENPTVRGSVFPTRRGVFSKKTIFLSTSTFSTFPCFQSGSDDYVEKQAQSKSKHPLGAILPNGCDFHKDPHTACQFFRL